MKKNKFAKTHTKKKADTAKKRVKDAPKTRVFEVTHEEVRMCDVIASTLCAWACSFFKWEPTADNMRSVYECACNRARLTLEMEDFADKPFK